jgi:hypothetical protein
LFKRRHISIISSRCIKGRINLHLRGRLAIISMFFSSEGLW